MASQNGSFQQFLDRLSADAKLAVVSAKQTVADADITPQWHVLVVPDADEPFEHAYDALGDVRAYLMSLIGADVSCFVYFGVKARITGGQFRYIVLPDGKQVPLFHLPDAGKEPDDCYMGEKQDVELTAAVADDDVEEYDEDEDFVEETTDEAGGEVDDDEFAAN